MPPETEQRAPEPPETRPWECGTDEAVFAVGVAADLFEQRAVARMSSDEVRGFLASQQFLQAATVEDDGSPRLTTLPFGVVDGLVVFEAPAASRAVENLERDDRIAVLVEAGSSYENLRGVTISGRARLVHDPSEIESLARAAAARRAGSDPDPPAGGGAAHVGGSVVVVVEPERMASWDNAKLA